MIDFQAGSTGTRFAEATQVRATLHAFFLRVAEVVEAQADDTCAVAKPYQQAATLAHYHIGTADHAFDHGILAGTQCTNRYDAGPVLVTQRQMEQHVLQGFQPDPGQLFCHRFTDALERRDRDPGKLAHFFSA